MKKRLSMVFAAVVAALCASAEPTVSNVTAKQRYPWNGLVDITCKVTGISGTTNGLKFAVKAVIPDTGIDRHALNFWVMKGGTNSTDLAVHSNGNYRLLWDARADLGQMRHTNMVVCVTFAVHNFTAHEKVRLWAGGPYWATTNIGAEEPWEYGYYFWWGDTVGYTRSGGTWTDPGYDSSWYDVTWVASNGSPSDLRFDYDDPISGQTCDKSMATLQSESWITADGVLAPEHDAAHVQWGGSWRMPTEQELSDLHSKCSWTWTTKDGVYGWLVSGTGNYASASIFLPSAGYGDGTSLQNVGWDFTYWSSVPDSDDNYAWCLYRNATGRHTGRAYRSAGKSVRPVQGFTE